MELDDLKAAWSQQAVQIDLLRAEQTAQRIRPALTRLRVSIAVELAVLALIVIALGSFTYGHRVQTGLAVSGILLMLYTLLYVQGLIRQLIAIARVRIDEPVLALQRSLDRVRLVRTITVSAAIVAGTVVWLPMLAVAASALFGIDVYAVLSAAYLTVNVVFGAAIVLLPIAAARRFAGGSPMWRAISDGLSGRDLHAARAYAQTLDVFENG